MAFPLETLIGRLELSTSTGGEHARGAEPLIRRSGAIVDAVRARAGAGLAHEFLHGLEEVVFIGSSKHGRRAPRASEDGRPIPAAGDRRPAHKPLYDFLPCRWPDASRSTSHLPRPFVTLLILHHPRSIAGILAVPPASAVGISFVEDDPKVLRSCVAWLRTAAEVDRDSLA